MFIFYHFSLENEKRLSPLALAIIFYALALFTIPWALPLLVVFPLYGWYLKGKKLDWPFYLILTVLTVAYFFLVFRAGFVGQKASTGAKVGGTHDITILIPFSITQYIYLMFWPKVLSFYHEGLTLSQDYVFWSRLFTVGFAVLLPAVLFWRKRKLPLFFLLFFLIAISPSLSPVKVGFYVAERYVYLGSISFCVFLAAVLIWLEKKLPIKNLALFLLIPILLLYSIRTFIRNDDWQTRASFWIATAKDTPTSYRAYNNLGDVYGWRGDWSKAIKAFQTAIKLKSNYDTPRYNLGIAYLSVNNLEGAKEQLQAALKLNPQHYKAYYILGVLSFKEGNTEEAKKHWEKCLEINPNYQDALRRLSSLENM